MENAVDRAQMLTLRCTHKLLARLKTKPAPTPPASTTKLGDWYANTLNVRHERLILCVSELTLLPVLVPAAGPDLPAKLAGGLRGTLQAIGVPALVIDAELNHMKHTTIAKTANRVVLGSMNDFENLVAGYRPHQHSLLDVGLEVAEAPCKPIRYQRPKDAAVVALRSKPSLPVAKLRIPQPAKPKRTLITDAEYERMVEEATVDAYGDEEQATGWHCVIDEHLKMPFETEVLGVFVRVEKIELLDDLSIVALCRRGPHRQTVLLLHLPIPNPPPEGAEWIEAYRRWKE